MDFKTLKKNSQKSLQDLSQKLDEISNKSQSQKDDRFWTPTVDKVGNGSAVIRFLPAGPGEDVPFIRMFHHAFQNKDNNLWYIENSLTTIGQEDPVNCLAAV